MNTGLLHIRPFQPADEAAVIGLWRMCGLVVPQNNPAADIARKLRVAPEWFLVGEREGAVVATCMAGYEGHRGWINYLAVHPDHRRQSLARQIMEHAEALLRAAGCPKINLQVRRTNSAVIAFYESIGFSVDEVVSLGKRLQHDSPQDGAQS
ncbi:GNAT family acetyltransferase [Prosthecobacter sp.]|uniref:GNAT family acetyltransferase n=1 Tax=Prosthecobacter sp. TaxID=1965333 RepID=UPI003784208A